MDTNNKRKIDAYKKTIDQKPTPLDKEHSKLEENAFVKDLSFSEKALSFAKLPHKTQGEAAGEAAAEADGGKDSKYRRVAKFLILLGSEQASSVLENLGEEQVEKISAEIVTIRGITKDEADEIFAEFQGLLAERYLGGSYSGGVEEARKLLYAAFGKEKGDLYLRRAVPGTADTSFAFLEDFSGEQISMLLHGENPATGALILSRIDPKCSAAALKWCDPKWRLETMRRIGHIEQVSPDVLLKVADGLRAKVRKIGHTSTSNVDGMGSLAAILKNADISFTDKLLQELGEDDPLLSTELREKLYTLDDVVLAEDRPIQEKLHGMSIIDIAILIKGRSTEFNEKVLSNISAGRRAEVKDELAFMAPITKKDSDAALKKFMDWFRTEREAGRILLEGDEDLVM